MIQNAFTDLLHTRIPSAFYENYRYDVSPVGDDRPVLLLHRPAARSLHSSPAPTASADYKINRAVPLLFGLVAISIARDRRHSAAAAASSSERVSRASAACSRFSSTSSASASATS